MTLLDPESFALTLAAQSKTHEDWLALIRFGLGTLLENQSLLAEIIVNEAIREADKMPNRKPGDDIGKILRELKLRLTVANPK